jgi:hypothetical protein
MHCQEIVPPAHFHLDSSRFLPFSSFLKLSCPSPAKVPWPSFSCNTAAGVHHGFIPSNYHPSDSWLPCQFRTMASPRSLLPTQRDSHSRLRFILRMSRVHWDVQRSPCAYCAASESSIGRHFGKAGSELSGVEHMRVDSSGRWGWYVFSAPSVQTQPKKLSSGTLT